MFVLALAVDIHVPTSQSLKAKRQVVRSVLQAAQHRFGVSVAEVGGQDTWQRAEPGFAVVASSAGPAEAVTAEVARLVWSRPDLDGLSCARTGRGTGRAAGRG